MKQWVDHLPNQLTEKKHVQKHQHIYKDVKVFPHIQQAFTQYILFTFQKPLCASASKELANSSRTWLSGDVQIELFI